MMSTDWMDAAYDDYLAEQAAQQLYEEHRIQAVEEFTAERLRSFYVNHPNVAEPALRCLRQSRRLRDMHASASFVFASIAMELGIKSLLIRPVVYGLVHQESAASLVTDLVLSHAAFDRFRDLLFQILDDHGGINLRTHKRPSSNQILWEEMRKVQSRRNALFHRGEEPNEDDVHLSVAVATTVLEDLVPAVLLRLRLHLHDGRFICDGALCRAEP